ncbi:hypothetical protein DAPPUDRAFT_308544 [Daphnia pulex]|uniref:Gamma-interferon inducible lysosomal thiol reductase n=1 Tax=Daphnia pulex TaxID=6669 RepID=E9H7Y3_DAPPU|nr:hypothetical protein DAPPUDRAFT_308544 [Daphnia pulex]|eukprot:EFX72165.1 hypothetical protein DAPPUDRAFT_308544 [Daphnia pulex]
MFKFLLASALLCVSFVNTAGLGNSGRTNLDVYYESLCPDSRAFLVNQLAPQWKSLSSFVNLRLIPFGKASFSQNSSGGWSFKCQHGSAECTGNILHACGIKYSKDNTQALNYASCLMRAPTSGAQCAELAGLDFTPIDTCTKTSEGQELAVAHGTETLTLQPTLTFVPWVVYDKVFDDGKQWSSLSNLRSVACNHNGFNAPSCLSNVL